MQDNKLKILGMAMPAFDSIGIAASSLCLVHCLALPFLLLLLPTLMTNYLNNNDDITHKVLAFFVVSACLLGLLPGYLKHKNRNVLLLMLCGMGLVLLATLANLGHRSIEISVMTIGNIMLISGHWKNRRSELCCSTNQIVAQPSHEQASASSVCSN